MRQEFFAGVLVLSGVATPGLALTADDLWQGWRAAASGMGVTLQGQELHRGNTLRLSDLSLSAPDLPAKVYRIEGTLELTEAADGSVAVVPSETLRFLPPADVQGFSMEVHSNAARVVFQPALGWRGEVQARAVTVAVGYQGQVFDGTAGRVGTMNLKVSDLAGWLGSAPAADWMLDFDLAAGLMQLEITQQDEGLGSSSRDESDTRDVTLAGKITVPAAMKMERLGDDGALLLAFRSGFGFDLSSTQGVMQDHSVVSDAGGAHEITYSMQPGRAHLALTPEGVLAEADFAGGAWSVLDPDLPVSPLVLSSDGYRFALKLPLFATEANGDFHLALNSGNVTLDAAGWAALDPQAKLPHDPARLEMDMSGQLQMNPRIFEDLPADDLPFRQFSLDLTRLLLRAAGAEAQGTGKIASNPDDPFGQPTGEARLHLSGVNGLLERLVEMGVVAKGDLFPIRAGLAMFTDAAEGEDQLQSNLEAREDGSLWVNHQRMR